PGRVARRAGPWREERDLAHRGCAGGADRGRSRGRCGIRPRGERGMSAQRERVGQPATSRGPRKVRTGVVVSEAMDKTVMVRIEQVVRHRAYGKTMRRSSKLAAHDATNDAHVGDTVRVVETRPLSKTKRWRVVEIV